MSPVAGLVCAFGVVLVILDLFLIDAPESNVSIAGAILAGAAVLS